MNLWDFSAPNCPDSGAPFWAFAAARHFVIHLIDVEPPENRDLNPRGTFANVLPTISETKNRFLFRCYNANYTIRRESHFDNPPYDHR